MQDAITTGSRYRITELPASKTELGLTDVTDDDKASSGPPLNPVGGQSIATYGQMDRPWASARVFVRDSPSGS